MRAWTALLSAVGLEVFGTLSLKYTALGGLTLLGLPLGVLLTALCVGASYVLLSLAFRRIPVAVAFAVWEAAGLALVTLLGAVLLGEHLTLPGTLALGGLGLGAWLLHRGTRAPAAGEVRA